MKNINHTGELRGDLEKKEQKNRGGEKGVKKGINQTEWSSSTPSEKKTLQTAVLSPPSTRKIILLWLVVL